VLGRYPSQGSAPGGGCCAPGPTQESAARGRESAWSGVGRATLADLPWSRRGTPGGGQGLRLAFRDQASRPQRDSRPVRESCVSGASQRKRCRPTYVICDRAALRWIQWAVAQGGINRGKWPGRGVGRTDLLSALALATNRLAAFWFVAVTSRLSACVIGCGLLVGMPQLPATQSGGMRFRNVFRDCRLKYSSSGSQRMRWMSDRAAQGAGTCVEGQSRELMAQPSGYDPRAARNSLQLCAVVKRAPAGTLRTSNASMPGNRSWKARPWLRF